MRLLGISGSLRKNSYNTLLLKSASAMLENQAAMTIFDLTDLPFYNADHDGVEKPVPVQQFIDAISEADGILIATPEYNYSIPGVLKNALDWASRPAYKSVLVNKPAAIVSASQSALGGVRAQVHLRDVLAATLTPVFPAPDCFLSMAQNAFNAGELVDEAFRQRIKRYLEGYIDWVEKSSGD